MTRISLFVGHIAALLATFYLCGLAVGLQAPSDARLDLHLRAWGKAMEEVVDIRCKFERVVDDRVFQTKEVTRGEVLVRPHDLLRINENNDKGALQEVFLFDGDTIRWYNLRARVECILEIGVADAERARGWWGRAIVRGITNARWIYYGFSVGIARKLFRLHLAKEDEHCVYVDLWPLQSEFRGDFEKLHVILDKKTHLPRQIQLIQPNENVVTISFHELILNGTPRITPELVFKNLPRGLPKLDTRSSKPAAEGEAQKKR